MIARWMPLIGAALALLLPGCAVEQQDFETLREQVRLQQRQINELRARQEEQGLRVDTLSDGFKILSDKAEDNSRRIDEQGERSTGALPPAPAAPAPVAPPLPPGAPAVPAPPSPAPVAAPAPVPAPAPAPAVEPPVMLTNQPRAGAPATAAEEIITAGPKAEKLYASALSLYSNREYQQATGKFEEFVATYPDHKLAGNAQYWIGECYYSQKRHAEAAEQFAKVERIYPASPKVPAALLKMGLSLAEIKKWPEARAALQRIMDKYPQSEEAAKARERLALWKQQQ